MDSQLIKWWAPGEATDDYYARHPEVPRGPHRLPWDQPLEEVRDATQDSGNEGPR